MWVAVLLDVIHGDDGTLVLWRIGWVLALLVFIAFHGGDGTTILWQIGWVLVLLLWRLLHGLTLLHLARLLIDRTAVLLVLLIHEILKQVSSLGLILDGGLILIRRFIQRVVAFMIQIQLVVLIVICQGLVIFFQVGLLVLRLLLWFLDVLIVFLEIIVGLSGVLENLLRRLLFLFEVFLVLRWFCLVNFFAFGVAHLGFIDLVGGLRRLLHGILFFDFDLIDLLIIDALLQGLGLALAQLIILRLRILLVVFLELVLAPLFLVGGTFLTTGLVGRLGIRSV